MITVICPYCENGIALLFDKLDELMIKNKSICVCNNCKKNFIAYNGKTQIETKKKDDMCET